MNDDIHALIGAYALDAVTEQERAEFEEHLQACGECRAELAGLRGAISALGASIPATPPPALRETILDRISAVRPLPPVVDTATGGPQRTRTQPDPGADDARSAGASRRSRRRWLAAAAAAVVIVVGGVTWHPWTGSQPAPVSAVQQVLHAPDAHRYVAQFDGATATVVFSPRLGRSVLVSRHLAPAPTGHTYQLWYLTATGQATGAGFVSPSATGNATVLLHGDADKAALVGITVEPTGGSPQPTTKPILTIALAT